MERTTIELKVIRDTCLGYEVFRGSAPAKDIVEACWIDFHHPQQNSLGYQRDFDEKRSQKARDYAETGEKSFWPECILAIRKDDEIDEREKVKWGFQLDPNSNEPFGTLSVTYTKGLTNIIYEQPEPWRRAFSQVDCQHRLGSMADSEQSITFCVIPGISRREEAKVFRAINQNQKGIPTSLVDTIIFRTDPDAPANISWAWNLFTDVGSPFYNRVDTGGRGQEDTLIKFRGLQQSLNMLIPVRHVVSGDIDATQGYLFARNYWNTVKQEWPTEFEDKNNYKMMVNPGVRALSRIGRKVFDVGLDSQNFGADRIEQYLKKGKENVDWSSTGPLMDATGKGAEKRVFEQLLDWLGEPN